MEFTAPAGNSAFVLLPEHHHHPVGSSHLDVRGRDGVLLPLLCRLLFVPLPVSMQEKAHPGPEGKTLHHSSYCVLLGEGEDERRVIHGGQMQIKKAKEKNTTMPEIAPYP